MVPPNGLRYPLVGGTRQRSFAGTSFEARKVSENAQTPTTMAPTHFGGDRVHAGLGGFLTFRSTIYVTVSEQSTNLDAH